MAEGDSVREAYLSRRRFLSVAAGVGAAAFVPPTRQLDLVLRAHQRLRLPPPARSGIDHIVVLTMENRSFDHLLGWLPGADGRQAGLTYQDGAGNPHSTFALAPDYRGCGYADPDHSHAAGLTEWDNGACDGFLRAQTDLFAIGYYRREDLQFLGRAAPMWTACDRYFSSVMGPTMPNRIALSAGVADRLDSGSSPSSLPTIWDRLLARKLPARYYTHSAADNTPLAVWSPKYDGIIRPFNAFFADARAGKLPAVAYLDPELGASSGPLQDDHPFADFRAGESLMADVYNAIVTSPTWPRTLLVINFDEWGGFFDHVSPPTAADSRPDYALRGFRVPALLVSPFARRGYVSHVLFDHASVLRTIEWRWSLAPLSSRDGTANNLAAALDFSRPNRRAPLIEVPKAVSSPSC